MQTFDLSTLRKPTAEAHTEVKLKLSRDVIDRLNFAQSFTGQDRSTIVNAVLDQYLPEDEYEHPPTHS